MMRLDGCFASSLPSSSAASCAATDDDASNAIDDDEEAAEEQQRDFFFGQMQQQDKDCGATCGGATSLERQWLRRARLHVRNGEYARVICGVLELLTVCVAQHPRNRDHLWKGNAWQHWAFGVQLSGTNGVCAQQFAFVIMR